MKKRIFSVLLAIVMVVGLLPATSLTASATECAHTPNPYVGQTCGGYLCTSCNELYGEANPDNHKGIPDKCPCGKIQAIKINDVTVTAWEQVPLDGVKATSNGSAEASSASTAASVSSIQDGKLVGTKDAPVQIGVFINEGSREYNWENVKFTHKGSAWTSGYVYWEGADSKQKISAYYPWIEYDYINYDYSFEVTADGTTDYLYALPTALTSANVSLNMEHALSKIVLNPTLGSEASGETIAKIEVGGMYASGKWKFAKNTWSELSGTTTLEMTLNSEGNYELLVIPMDSCTSIPVTVTMTNGKVYTAEITALSALESGKQYNIPVWVNCHIYSYTDKANGTHTKTCSGCGVTTTEAHTEVWALNEAGNSITVSCEKNCGYTDSATISVSDKAYDGVAVEATVNKTGVFANTDFTVSYKVKDGGALNSAPSDAGNYTASITYNDGASSYTASVDFAIRALTVTWSNGDGGSYEQTVAVGATITVPTSDIFKETVRKGGYEITGWTSSDSNYTVGTAMPAKDLTFTAQYTPAALTGTVTISGTVKVGETLTATVSNTNNTGTLSYQWYRKRGDAVSSITGATSGTYTITANEVQHSVYCVVTSSVQTGSIQSGETDAVPLLVFAEGDITVSGYSGTYDGQYHGITVTAPEGSVVEYTTEDGVDQNSYCREYLKKDAGTYTIYYRVDKYGYAMAHGVATIQIDKATLNVTADTLYAEIGDACPTPTYTITGFVDGETAENVEITGTPTLSYSESPDMRKTGTYTINVDTTGMSAKNYEFKGASGSLTVLEHVHNFNYYTLNDNGDGLFAKCSDRSCGDTLYCLLYIYAPTDAVYEQGTSHTASVTACNPQVNVASGDIVYTKDDIVTAPVNAGTYTASITYGDATARVTYEVAKRPLTVTAPSQSVYVGSQKPDLTQLTATVDGLVGSDTVDVVLSYVTEPDMNRTGEYGITATVTDASGNYAVTVVGGKLTVRSHPSYDDDDYVAPSSPAVESVTVPISGDEETIHVDASVSGDTATVDHVDLDHLDTVIGDGVQTGTVTIDFSGLDSSKPITTVEIPSDVVKEIAAAVSDPDNDAQSLEIILSDGTSIEFDAEALGEKAAQADGLDITISIEHSDDVKTLTSAQKNTLGDRTAFDISVTSGGEHISDMGGKITVHAPYELRDGEKAAGIVVWYVDDNGNKERCETSYDPVKQRVNWKTDHLSLYMIDYDEDLATNPFADIVKESYYFDAVLWAYGKGITGGTSATTFSPNDPCTRAQMATFLWRAAGSPEPVGTPHTFTDVPEDAYYAKAVQWAYEQKITVGTSATTFSPDAACTRAQMATFIYRYEQANGGGFTGLWMFRLPFTDAPEWAFEPIAWCYKEGITVGTSATTFSPDDPCTRAQMMTFLYRYFTN